MDGHDTVVPGLVSVRTAEPDTFLTLPMGVGFEEVRPADIVTVDAGLNVVSGNGQPPKAVGFLLKMRTSCAPRYAAASTPTRRGRRPCRCSTSRSRSRTWMRRCSSTTARFCANGRATRSPSWKARSSRALGSKRAILLANHVLAAVGETIEEACWMALCFERAARMQLGARAVGKLSAIDPDYASDAHDYLTDPSMIATQFRRFARRVLRSDPHCLD